MAISKKTGRNPYEIQVNTKYWRCHMTNDISELVVIPMRFRSIQSLILTIE